MDAVHWTLFGVNGLLAASLLCSLYCYRQLERRVGTIELADSASDVRRAHIRLDNQARQLESLARQLGWVDDRSHTKVLTIETPLELFKKTP